MPFTARVWTAHEIALLGTAPDGVIARRVKRTVKAVTNKRRDLAIPVMRDRRGRILGRAEPVS